VRPKDSTDTAATTARAKPGAARSGRSASRAFTLVELLIGASLSAAVMAAVLSSYIYLGRNLARLANQQTLETESRRAIAYFVKDVEAATGISGTPNVSKIGLTVPTANGTNTITYRYNNSTTAEPDTISGTNVTMAATSLTRYVYNGSTLTSQVLLRNISDASATNFDLFFRYYDASGGAYDSGGYPYTTSTSYTIGIKSVSMHFSVQTGNDAAGTLTRVYSYSTGFLAMRNRSFLP